MRGLIGIYRGGSPLSPLNSAAAPGIVSLTVGDGIVEIPPQEAGFASTTQPGVLSATMIS